MRKSFLMVTDSDGDPIYKSNGGKLHDTLEQATEHAEQSARSREDDMFILKVVRIVGPSKAPLERVDF